MRPLGIDDEDQAMRRRAASAIAQQVAPAIQQAMASIPSFVEIRPVEVKADKPIFEAAQQVANAIRALDQAKYSSLGEVGARLALERSARMLCIRLEQRQAELSNLKASNRKPKETSNGNSAD